MEDGDSIDVAYLDFAKVFDSVPHQWLIHELHGYGMRGKLLEWITAFLLDHQLRVVVQGPKSTWARHQWYPEGISSKTCSFHNLCQLYALGSVW